MGLMACEARDSGAEVGGTVSWGSYTCVEGRVSPWGMIVGGALHHPH